MLLAPINIDVFCQYNYILQDYRTTTGLQDYRATGLLQDYYMATTGLLQGFVDTLLMDGFMVFGLQATYRHRTDRQPMLPLESTGKVYELVYWALGCWVVGL